MGIILGSLIVLGIALIFHITEMGGYSSVTKKHHSSGIEFIRHHEERHKIQDAHGFLKLYSYVLLVAMFLTLLTQAWQYMFPALIAFVAIELDAWLYSIWRKINGSN